MAVRRVKTFILCIKFQRSIFFTFFMNKDIFLGCHDDPAQGSREQMIDPDLN